MSSNLHTSFKGHQLNTGNAVTDNTSVLQKILYLGFPVGSIAFSRKTFKWTADNKRIIKKVIEKIYVYIPTVKNYIEVTYIHI